MRRGCSSHALTLLLLAVAVLAADPDRQPELRNGLGGVHVVTFADHDQDENAVRLRVTCHSKLKIASGWGRPWSWHEKFLRLLPVLRDLRDDELVLVLDGDTACFPCGRNLTEQFLRFHAGVVVTGYPFYQEPTREKTGWFPPHAILLDTYPDTEAGRRQKDHLQQFKYVNAGTVMGFAGALKHYIAEFYMRTGAMEWKAPLEFDDQEFWAVMYLAQVYGPHTQRFHGRPRFHPHHQGSPHPMHEAFTTTQIAVDAEGLIAQINLLYYKGKFRRTKQGYLQRDDPYGKEVCVLHLVGHKHYIGAFMERWNDPTKGATPEDELFGGCELPPKDDPDWNWRLSGSGDGHMKCSDKCDPLKLPSERPPECAQGKNPP